MNQKYREYSGYASCLLIGLLLGSVLMYSDETETQTQQNNMYFAEQFSQEVLSPSQAGELTEDFVNLQILRPSPNNVSARFISAQPADDEGLENFYKVKLSVENPAGDEETEVFTKKDGSLVFLQFPRRMDAEEFDPNRYH